MTYETLKTTLADLTNGLLFISESESPFDIVALNSDAPGQFAAVSGLPAPDFQQEDAVAFLNKIIRNATADPDDAVMMQLAKRYEALQQFLVANLTDLHLYRAGKPRSHIFICGKTAEGKELALHTVAVMT